MALTSNEKKKTYNVVSIGGTLPFDDEWWINFQEKIEATLTNL